MQILVGDDSVERAYLRFASAVLLDSVKCRGRTENSDTEDFGCEPALVHTQCMFTRKDVYIPFAMLPIEARVLFCMLSLAELADHRPWPPSPAEIHACLERVWDAEKLTRISHIPIVDWGESRSKNIDGKAVFSMS